MIVADCVLNCALKQKLGDFVKIEYISTENLFKESNQQRDCSSQPLAELCEDLLWEPVEKLCRSSERICKACGR